MQIARAPLDYAPSEADIRFFAAHGYLITPPLFDEETLREAREEIERCWHERTASILRSSERGAASKADYSRVRPELQRLHLDSPVLARFCRHRQLGRIAHALIGEDADLSWNQAYTKASGGDLRTAIPWHQDAWYAEVDGATYNCWVAITDCTVENGTIVRAPKPLDGALRPHVWDDLLLFYRCEIEESTAEPVELAPGQAFIFTGAVPHRSGVNLTQGERVSYSISFAAPTARLRANGEVFGDRVPVVRGGRHVSELIEELLSTPDDASHPGARLIEDICARAPSRVEHVRETFTALVEASSRDDVERREVLLDRLLAVLPDSEDVLGDLVRARARVDQLLRELTAIRGSDPRTERLLVERALSLDPAHVEARAELARLDASHTGQRGTK